MKQRTTPSATRQAGFRSAASQPVTHQASENHHGDARFVVWFTGLSGAGKSTLASQVEKQLRERGRRTALLDGDQMRRGLCADLGFSQADRRENLRRVGEVSRLFVDNGMIVLAAFVSPFRDDRHMVRSLLAPDHFIEVYCDASLGVCEQRDVKGLYSRARHGEIPDFTGISSPYQAPETAELVVHTGTNTIEDSVAQVMDYLIQQRKLVS